MQPTSSCRRSTPAVVAATHEQLHAQLLALYAQHNQHDQQQRTPLILDARPASRYLAARLAGSVNIPLERLTQQCYLLPDKACPFAVVVPAPSDYVVVTEPAQHGAARGTATAVYLKGAASLPLFLSTRGWCAVRHTWPDTPALWAAAQGLGLLEEGPPGNPAALARRCLFAPSELLAQSVPGIEAALALQQARAQQSQRPQAHGHQGQGQGQEPQQRQQEQAGQAPAPLVLHALDVGCGSGRDVCWLASRNRVIPLATGEPTGTSTSNHSSADEGTTTGKQQQQQQQCQQQQHHHQQQHALAPGQHGVALSWRVTGLDEWLGALERAAECAEAMQLTAQQVQLLFARVNPDIGTLEPLEVPPNSSLAGSPWAAVAPPVLGKQSVDGEGSAGRASVLQAGAQCPAVQQYDLVLCCRVLIRALLPALRQMVAPGGFVVYCTFLDLPGVRAVGRPSGAEHLLKPGELAAQHFGPGQGFTVVRDEVSVCFDGRELCWFVAQKREALL